MTRSLLPNLVASSAVNGAVKLVSALHSAAAPMIDTFGMAVKDAPRVSHFCFWLDQEPYLSISLPSSMPQMLEPHLLMTYVASAVDAETLPDWKLTP